MVTKKERNNFRNEIQIAEKMVEEQENEVWEYCRNFYRGNQHFDLPEDADDQLTVNFIFSNIVSQLPKLTYTAPQYNVKPGINQLVTSPGKLKVQEKRAEIMERILERHRQQNEFRKHFQLGVLDSLLSMGIFKTFHKTKTVKNPKAGQTVIDPETGKPVTIDGDKKKEPERIPTKTEFKVHRVRPENFLVDPRAGNFLESANWVAEKIFMGTSEAKRMFNDNDIPSVKKISADIKEENMSFRSPVRGFDDHSDEDLDLSVVYEVWDTKQKRKFYMVRGIEDKVYKETQTPEAYTEFNDNTPYTPLKHHEVPDQFYPIPDIYPQIQIQKSYNKARNDVNEYRDMFKTKFLAEKGALDHHEKQKLQSSRAGEVIEMDRNPNQNPPFRRMDQPGNVPGQVIQSLQLDKQDLQEVSGITELQRGGQSTQGQKATQSILANQSAQAKMNWKLMHITNAANRVGKKLSELIMNRKKIGGVVKNTREGNPDFLKFSPEDLVGDFEIEAEYGSTSPDNKQGEKQEFLEAMRLVSSFPQVLQHFDSRQLAKEFTKHFPLAKKLVKSRPDPQAFQSQQSSRGGGSGGAPQDQGQVGASAQSQMPNPQTSEQGVREVQNQIRGGLG